MKIPAYTLNQNPSPVSKKAVDMPPDVAVSYDAQKDCYEYEAPGYHRTVQRLNPWKEGGKAAAVVGVPSLLGAVETATLGLANSSLINLAVSPATGALVGAGWMGHGAWKETGKNPLFTGLAAMLGGGVGAVALPLLKAPGTFAGLPGVLVAAGTAGVGVALWSVHQNHLADQEALAHGYKPAS